MNLNNSILVGDVGGTNVRFGIAEKVGLGKFLIHEFQKFPVGSFLSLEAVLERYLNQIASRPKICSLGVAGQTQADRVTLPNSGWSFSCEQIRKKFGFRTMHVCNDFKAMARSIPSLPKDSFETILKGRQRRSQQALTVVAGPGTGFGMAVCIEHKDRVQVISGEGGFQAYSPQTLLEKDVHSILTRDHDFVSLELVTSGSGLSSLFLAVREYHNLPQQDIEPSQIQLFASQGDQACLDVIRIRAAATMQAVGDLAITCDADRVVLAGGVSEIIKAYLQAPEAIDRFTNRGSGTIFTKGIPIDLLVNSKAPLIGSAHLLQDCRSPD